MESKLTKVYYSPQSYWKGIAAIKKLADAVEAPEETQCIGAQRGPPNGPSFSATRQAATGGRKVYKYSLTVVDVASRYKEAEPLTSKDSAEVAKTFQSIYMRSPLTGPQLLQVDPGREFTGSVTKEMENHKSTIRRGRNEIHRDHVARWRSAYSVISTP